MGFQIHHSDIESFMVDKLGGNMLQAQKFDLSAYMRDGNYIQFTGAYRNTLLRYSETFVREKFFGEPKEDARRKRKLRKLRKMKF